MPIRIEEYVREDGSNPYKKWFDGLDPQSAAKVTTAKLRLELGNTSSIKWFAGMGECVIDWGPGYRIYLAKDGDTLIVLFGGGTKRGQSSATSIRPRPCWRSTRHARRSLSRWESPSPGSARGDTDGTDS
jgi:putative addiction module killer protein